MTRINCVPPTELIRQHLIAEYREIARVFKLADAAHKRGWVQRIHGYRLGRGHVEFFYDKLEFVRKRHASLANEMIRRGYNPTIDCSTNGTDLPAHFQNDWLPRPKDIKINRARIKERTPTNA